LPTCNHPLLELQYEPDGYKIQHNPPAVKAGFFYGKTLPREPGINMNERHLPHRVRCLKHECPKGQRRLPHRVKRLLSVLPPGKPGVDGGVAGRHPSGLLATRAGKTGCVCVLSGAVPPTPIGFHRLSRLSHVFGTARGAIAPCSANRSESGPPLRHPGEYAGIPFWLGPTTRTHKRGTRYARANFCTQPLYTGSAHHSPHLSGGNQPVARRKPSNPSPRKRRTRVRPDVAGIRVTGPCPHYKRA
jgi:hypothetical protein